jgi:hypothetical protein
MLLVLLFGCWAMGIIREVRGGLMGESFLFQFADMRNADQVGMLGS